MLLTVWSMPVQKRCQIHFVDPHGTNWSCYQFSIMWYEMLSLDIKCKYESGYFKVPVSRSRTPWSVAWCRWGTAAWPPCRSPASRTSGSPSWPIFCEHKFSLINYYRHFLSIYKIETNYKCWFHTLGGQVSLLIIWHQLHKPFDG